MDCTTLGSTVLEQCSSSCSATNRILICHDIESSSPSGVLELWDPYTERPQPCVFTPFYHTDIIIFNVCHNIRKVGKRFLEFHHNFRNTVLVCILNEHEGIVLGQLE